MNSNDTCSTSYRAGHKFIPTETLESNVSLFTSHLVTLIYYIGNMLSVYMPKRILKYLNIFVAKMYFKHR